MRPTAVEMRVLYKDYLRGEVKRLLPAGAILFGLLSIIAMGRGLKQTAFNKLDEKLTGETLFFFIFGSLGLIFWTIFLISRKFPVALDFIPVLLIMQGFFTCLPTFFDDPKEPTIVKGDVLL